MFPDGNFVGTGIAKQNMISVQMWKDDETHSQELNSSSMDFELTKIESDVSKSKARDQLNESLESIGSSPIKTHIMPKHRRVSYASERLIKTI